MYFSYNFVKQLRRIYLNKTKKNKRIKIYLAVLYKFTLKGFFIVTVFVFLVKESNIRKYGFQERKGCYRPFPLVLSVCFLWPTLLTGKRRQKKLTICVQVKMTRNINILCFKTRITSKSGDSANSIVAWHTSAM